MKLPRMVEMKVGKKMPVTGSRCVFEFDAGTESPVEVMEAVERMFAAWPASRIPVKSGVAPGTVCGCGQVHDGWACSHCTPRPADALPPAGHHRRGARD